MGEDATLDPPNLASAALIDHKVFCHDQVGTCGDRPADLALRKPSAKTDIPESRGRQGVAPPPEQGDTPAHPVHAGRRKGAGIPDHH